MMTNQRQHSGRLDAAARNAALEAMQSEELDILVIGGGIVGVGAAMDAATRGLTVGLVEARDYASGTSSESSKLVHGGIRYLEQLDFHLVQEALTERGMLLQKLAPHLVKPIRFLYPVHHRIWERAYIGAGMMLYDLFSYTGLHRPGVPHHRHMSARQVRMAAPALREDVVIGGMYYYDGRVDDARYVVNLARTAAHYGAHMANRASVEKFITKGKAIVGAEVRDGLTGATYTIKAKEIINATGVWTGLMQELASDEDDALKVRASKGVHILIPKKKFASNMGLILRTEKSVLFVIPWGRHWIVGTTDTDWQGDLAHPAATSADIQYILDHLNAVVNEPVTQDDIEGVYVGLRPLLASKQVGTSKLSREHLVTRPKPGLTMIAGGKWTTYRVMAKDAVDAAVSMLPQEVPESVTAHVPLLGASGYKAAWNRRKIDAQDAGLSQAQYERLLNRFGSMAQDVLDLIAENPGWAQPLAGTEDYLEAEVVYAARFEGALHVEDVLCRRTRMTFELRDSGEAAAPRVAALMATELGWDTRRRTAEVQNYLERIAAERASHQLVTDDAANAARLTAPDISTVPAS